MKTNQTNPNRTAMLTAFIAAVISATVLGFGSGAKASNTWNGGGSSPFNWSATANWGGAAPAYGTISFSGSAGTVNTLDGNFTSAGNTSMSQINWNGSSAWTMNNANSTVLSLFDNSGTQSKVENYSSGLVTINAPITYAATAGAAWGELNAVNGGITFGSSGTLTVNGSQVSYIKMFGAGQTLTLNNTVSASGKAFYTTAASGDIISIGGSVTTGDFFVMNGSALNLNSGGSLTTTALRLGGDYGTTLTQNQAFGATFNLTSTTGGQTFGSLIDAVSGNTSGALVVGSANTSGTNYLTGGLYCDSPLKMTNAAGGTFSFTGGGDIKAQTLTFTPQGTMIIGSLPSTLAAGGNIVMNGSGTLLLTNLSNTYSGTSSSSLNAAATQISGGGVLGIYADLSLGVALGSAYNNIQFTGSGTLQDTFNSISLNANRNISIASGATATLDSSTNTFTINSVINGSGAVTKVGSGTLNLAVANTYGGGTTNSAGTLKFSNASAFGTGAVTLNGGTLQAGGLYTLTNNFTASAASVLDMAANNTTLSGNFSGSAALTLNNSGAASTLTLSGNNSSYGGTFTASGSGLGNAVSFSSANAGSASAAWVFNDSTIDRVRIAIGNGTINFGSISGSGQMQNDTSGTASIISVGALNTSTTFSGTIKDNGTGTLALTQVGTGTLTLSGASAYSGATTINAGTISLANATGAGTSVITVNSPGTLALNASTTADVTYANTVAGAGKVQFLYVSGAGGHDIYLNNLGSFTGTIELSLASGSANTGGKARLYGATLSGTSSLIIDSGTQLFMGGGNVTLANIQVSGTGNTENRGAIRASTGTLAGAISLMGDTTIGTEGGTISGNISSGASGTQTLTLGTANSTGNLTLSGNLGGGTGTIALNKTQAGTTTLSGANTYSGGTTLSAGQLNINNAGSGGTSSAIGTGMFTISGGTIDNTSSGDIALSPTIAQNWNGDFTYAGSAHSLNLGSGAVTLGANRQVTVSGNTLTVAGAISGGYNLTKTGSGTLTLSGANTYTGTTTVNGGTLAFSGSGSLGLTGTAAGQLTVNGSGANSIVNIGGSANIKFNSANVLDGNNATAAGAIFQAGTVTGMNQLKLNDVTGGYGYYNLSGGSLTYAELDGGGIDAAGTGVFDMSGGTVTNTTWFILARASGNYPVLLNLTGGTYNFTSGSANQFYYNWNANAGASAVINVANANFYATNATGGILNMFKSAAAGQLGVVNLLSGGLMQIQGVTGGNTTGTSHFNFNGGTLKASTANATFLTTALTAVNVYSGGGTIDNNSIAITIPAVLAAPAGYGISSSSISVPSGGSGYIGAPAVTFSGGSGKGATGYAVLNSGVVDHIVVSSPGTGYASSDTVTANFTGGGPATAATAVTGIAVAANTSGGMTFQGSSTTTLSGANTYTNTTAVNGGTLSITTGGSLSSSSPINVASGATLTTSVNNTFGSAPTGPWTIAGTITGTGNAQSMPASVTLNNGTMSGTTFATFGTFLVTSSGTTITANGANNTNNAGNFGLTGTLTVNTPNATDALTNSSVLGASSANAGGLTKTGAGTLTLSGANIYTGTTALNGGRANAGIAEVVGASGPFGKSAAANPGSITFGGGTLQYSSANQNDYSGRFSTAGSQPISIDLNGQSVTYATAIQGGGTSLTVANSAGSGKLTLSAVNTYSGATTINAGTVSGVVGGSCANSAVSVAATSGKTATLGVSITDNTKQWTCSGLTVNNAGTSSGLDFNFSYILPSTTLAPLNVGGNVTFTTLPTISVEGGNLPVSSGNGYPLMTWSGTGPSSVSGITLTLTSRLTGNLAIVGKTLYLQITANKEPLKWATSTSGTWDTSTSNWKDNTGTATAYNESTIPGDQVVFDDTYITANTTVTLNSTVNPYSVTFNNSTYNYINSGSGAIAGSASLTKSGTQALTLNGANTYSGGTTLNAGAIIFGNGSALGTGVVTANGGTLNWSYVSGNTTFTNNVAVNGPVTFEAAVGNWTFNGSLSGSGTITRGILGLDSLYLGGDNSGFTGTYQDQANGNAVTRITAASAGSANAHWIWNQGTSSRMSLNFGNGTINWGSMAGSGFVQQANTGTTVVQAGALGSNDVFSGVMQEAASGDTLAFTKVGTGAMTLSGASSYTGTTTVENGSLVAGAAVSVSANGPFGNASSAIALGDATSISGNLSPSLFVGGVFTLARPVTVGSSSSATTGIYTLGGSTANSDTFSGAITLNQSLVVTQATGGALTISGAIGGTASLTNVGPGKVILSTTNTYTGNTVIQAGTLALSGGGSISNTPNLIVAGGATFDVSGLTSPFTLGSSQTLSNSTSTAAISGTNSTGSGTVSLTYASGTPSFTMTNGTLTLSGTTTFKINNTGSALTAGSYLVISTNAGGLVAGTLPSVTVGGGGLAAGTIASLAVSSGQLYLVVKNITSTTLATSGSPSTYGQSVTFTATVSPAPATVGETISFLDGATVISTTNNAGGVATFTTGALAAGVHSLTAIYPGDTSNLGSTNAPALSQNVNPASLVITANSTNKVYGQNLVFAGTEFTAAGLTNGDTVSSVVLTSSGATNTAMVGSYDIVASSAAGGGLTNYTIGYSNGTLTVSQATPTNTLASSANPSGFQDTITFTNTLNADATGYVLFSTNSVLWSSNSLSGGVAVSLSITSLPRGTNLITAAYGGDTNYVGGGSITLNQVVTNHPPVANNNTYSRGTYATWQIAVSDLLTNATDVDGDTLTLVGVGGSTNGITLTIDTNAPARVQYYNTNVVSDQFTFTVTDGFGGTNSAVITLTAGSTNQVTGTSSIATITGTGVKVLTAYGIPGYTYVTQRATNLSQLVWENLATNTLATNAVIISVTDSNPPSPSAYYRLLWDGH